MSGRTIVKFRDVAEDVIEIEYRLDKDSEYMYTENTFLGDYEVIVEGECRVKVKNGMDVVLENDSVQMNLIAGYGIFIAQPEEELPEWSEAERNFRQGKL